MIRVRTLSPGYTAGLAAVLTIALGCGAAAQGTPGSAPQGSGGSTGGSSKAADGSGNNSSKSGAADPMDALKDVRITLNADHENLLDTLRTLMKSAKADFVIDADLKAGTATVHFKDVAFKDALSTVVKVSTYPITVEVKDGIFHFKHREDPPVVEKPAEDVKRTRPRFEARRTPLEQLGSADALRKLTGPYDSPPPMLYYHTTQPGSHGSVSSFGFSGSGLLQSNGFKLNPDGSVSRIGGPPINVINLLRGLLGGLGR